MDIISYSKAMKAKKSILALNKRLGEGTNKSGPKDIIDIHANTKKRLEELEKKRLGLIDSKYVINSDSSWSDGLSIGLSAVDDNLTGSGTWERMIDLGEDMIELVSITQTILSKPDLVKAYVDFGEEYEEVSFPLDLSGKVNRTFKVKLELSEITSDYSANLCTGGTPMAKDYYSSRYSPEQAFDNDISTYWHGADTNKNAILNGSWIGYKFNSPQHIRQIVINQKQLQSGANTVQVERKDKSDVWVPVGVFELGLTIKDNGVVHTIALPTSESSLEWRLVVLEGVVGGSGFAEGWKVQELKMMSQEPSTPVVDELVINYKARPLLNRVSELEKNTHINLNKHNLRVNTVLNHRRYKLKEMIIDDFKDSSGIDQVASTNITYDSLNHKVKQADAATQAKVVLIKEQLNTVPTMFTLSAVTSENNIITTPVDLSQGDFIQTEIINHVMSLKKTDGTFAKSGSWMSQAIDLGENVKNLSKLNLIGVVPDGTAIKVLTATSADGLDYEEFKELNLDNTLQSKNGRFIKVRIEMSAKGTAKPAKVIQDFTSEEAVNYESNNYIVLDGAAKLKTDYVQEMVADHSFVGEGTLLKTTLDKTMFKTIEKVEVK